MLALRSPPARRRFASGERFSRLLSLHGGGLYGGCLGTLIASEPSGGVIGLGTSGGGVFGAGTPSSSASGEVIGAGAAADVGGELGLGSASGGGGACV